MSNPRKQDQDIASPRPHRTLQFGDWVEGREEDLPQYTETEPEIVAGIYRLGIQASSDPPTQRSSSPSTQPSSPPPEHTRYPPPKQPVPYHKRYQVPSASGSSTGSTAPGAFDQTGNGSFKAYNPRVRQLMQEIREQRYQEAMAAGRENETGAVEQHEQEKSAPSQTLTDQASQPGCIFGMKCTLENCGHHTKDGKESRK